MNHAFLITAYKDFEQLATLVNVLGSLYDGFCFIHIDRKSKFNEDLFRRLCRRINFRIYRRFKVNWGSENHLRAALLMLQDAVDDPYHKFDYYHLITGQDLPLLKTKQEFEQSLGGKSWILGGKLPNEGWYRGGMSRIDKYHFLNFFNLKTKLGLESYKWWLSIQKGIGIEREFNNLELGWNSPYWSLTDWLASEIVDYEDILNAFDHFRYCYIPEEMYYYTVMLSSGIINYQTRDLVVNNSNRLEDWDESSGAAPATLTYEKHSEQVLGNPDNLIFARKFDMSNKSSRQLYNALLNKLLS